MADRCNASATTDPSEPSVDSPECFASVGRTWATRSHRGAMTQHERHRDRWRGQLVLRAAGVGRRVAIAVAVAVAVLATSLSGGVVRAGAAGRTEAIAALACVTDARCLAVGSAGRVIASQNADARRPQWHVVHIRQGGQLIAVSCAGDRLCVAVNSRGRVFLTRDPFGAVARWTPQPVPTALGASCPSVHLCVLVDEHPGLTIALNPAASRPQWITHRSTGVSSGTLGLTTGVIACMASRACVLGTLDGSVAVVPDVSAGRLVPRDLDFGEPSTFDGISCPGSGRCIAANEDGAIRVTAGVGLRRWRRRVIDGGAVFGDVTCPTAAACLLTDYGSDVFTSRSAFSTRATWRRLTIDAPAGQLIGAACPSTSMCLAFDSTGRILRSVDPFMRNATWTRLQV